mgnify:FL=1
MDREISETGCRQIAESAGLDKRERFLDGLFRFPSRYRRFYRVALGFLRANIWIVAVSMFLGKAIRYWVWMEFVYKVQGMF